ncbi:uracil-DNA glycosylase [Halalkalibacter okhensis]|uniref:Uracil-DNA glycosylase n=1 Tax=Halalkalibacter okhensis TaxID=333138 RepID=A0A0B0I8H7_9BACI|nr:uracil-DNA glycosylase [Halalkalibacter okhensis]KHF38793.1 uracil-DNA glycosylase [Halalkalibacter okhensis]
MKLTNDWQDVLNIELEKAYFNELLSFLTEEYEKYTVYPPKEEVFQALEYTSYSNTKVVILGQDPYHGPNQAHGLSFSVKPTVKIPPSLKNIYKELQADLGHESPTHGSLVSWAKQGVLLLNTVLTVRKSEAASHKGMGWELFTDAVIKALNDREQPVIFVLWGKHAQAKKGMITNKRHAIIEAAHPSPFSAHRGFLGSKPFSTIDQLLKENGQGSIEWEID